MLIKYSILHKVAVMSFFLHIVLTQQQQYDIIIVGDPAPSVGKPAASDGSEQKTKTAICSQTGEPPPRTAAGSEGTMENNNLGADMLAAAGMDPNTPPPEWMNQPDPVQEFYRYTVYINRNDPPSEGHTMSECVKCKTMHDAIQQIATCTEYDSYTVETFDRNGYYKIIEHNWDDQENIFYDRTQGTNGEIENVWINSYKRGEHQ